MQKTLQVEILHPNAERILKELAAVELIRIGKKESRWRKTKNHSRTTDCREWFSICRYL